MQIRFTPKKSKSSAASDLKYVNHEEIWNHVDGGDAGWMCVCRRSRGFNRLCRLRISRRRRRALAFDPPVLAGTGA